MENEEKAAGLPDPGQQADDARPLGIGPSEETQPSDEELFMAALDGKLSLGSEYDDAAFAPLKRGQIVKGTIASKSENEILVDVGVKSEGIITGRELEHMDSELRDSLRPGDEVTVYVLSSEGSGGHVQLSLQRVLEQQDWQTAEEYLQQGTAFSTRIVGFNKGGLIARLGRLRGFVPSSQIGREHQAGSEGQSSEERWARMVGQDITVKVIEIDHGRNRLILSERSAVKEGRLQKRAELMEALAVGQIHSGRVASLTTFGAFVDLGGVDGLIHLSQMSWEHITHPGDVLKVGDEVQVEIIELDQERQRVGLSRKKFLEDPWQEAASVYKPGQLVQGQITKLTRFGAFARLVDNPKFEGLIHISELAGRRVEHPREVVEEGQILTLRVLKVDTERRRIALSLKQVVSEEFIEADWQGVLGNINAAPVDSAASPAENTDASAAPAANEVSESVTSPVADGEESPVPDGEGEAPLPAE